MVTLLALERDALVGKVNRHCAFVRRLQETETQCSVDPENGGENLVGQLVMDDLP